MHPASAPPTAAESAQTVRHSIIQSIALHLAPGIVMLIFYLLAAPVVMEAGYPPMFASLLTIPLILVPVMLGYLSIVSRRVTGSYNPMAAVGYRNVLSTWKTAGYVVGLTLGGAAAFVAVESVVGSSVKDAAFGWLPMWFLNPAGLEAITGMPVAKQVVFLGSLLVFAGFVAPVVEELYFRGHLLPGISRLGVWAPVVSVALFTLYHFESPWEGPGRFVMVLPMVYAVWHTRSVRLGIIVHVVLNTLSALAVAAAVWTSA